MVKALLLTILMFTLPLVAQAQTTPVNNDPVSVSGLLSNVTLSPGISYDFVNRQLTNTETIELINWKGIALNFGYSTTSSLIMGFSYEITRLSKLGVTTPVLDQLKIEPFIWAGDSRISTANLNANKVNYGAGIKLLDIKF